VAGRVQLRDSEHVVRKMFYNTIGGRRPLVKPKRRWIAEAEENSRKVLSARHWKEKLSVYKVWRGYIQGAKAKYLCCAIAQESRR
jgi:hypothetical protein